jgi:hypothetical protein
LIRNFYEHYIEWAFLLENLGRTTVSLQNHEHSFPIGHKTSFRNWNQFHQNVSQDVKELLGF